MYFLGTISGASGAYYNNTTGVSGIGAFTIPANAKSLYLTYGASLSNVTFAFSNATGVTSFLNSANGAPVPPFGTIGGPYRVTQGTKVGIYNPNSVFVSVLVFAAPTS